MQTKARLTNGAVVNLYDRPFIGQRVTGWQNSSDCVREVRGIVAEIFENEEGTES
ncbi:MAG: hypothetical protein ACRCVX_02170 [Shewanella sp.]